MVAITMLSTLLGCGNGTYHANANDQHSNTLASADTVT
jgi:hypothetical protein